MFLMKKMPKSLEKAAREINLKFRFIERVRLLCFIVTV